MCELLIPVDTSEFKENVQIYFDNILTGFDLYKYFYIEAINNEKIIINFIKRIFEENDSVCYVDFYLNKLSNDDKNRLLSLVPDEDKELLKSHLKLNSNSIYYKVANISLIPFLTRLSTRENFFVTFYFTKIPLTIWGNYGMKFPSFCKNEFDLNYYLGLWNTYLKKKERIPSL